MKLQMRGGLAAIVIVGSAFIVAACGGSDSGAAKAAKDSTALDFIPKDALGYVTVDTDFSGENWSNVGDLAKAFDPDFKAIDEQLADQADGDDVDFQEDIDPWLGESGGAAILSVGGDHEKMSDEEMDSMSTDSLDDAKMFVWLEVDDRKALEDFAKEQGAKEGDDVGDFTVWTSKSGDNVIGVSDDLAIVTDSEDMLTEVVEYDGDSIKDVDGIGDAIDGVDGDSLGTLVISGDGLRAVAKDNEQLSSVAGSGDLGSIEAVAMAIGAEDDGFRLDGMLVSSDEGSAKNVEHPVLRDLPADTVLAIGGYNLGGIAKGAVETIGKDNAEVQQGVGAITAVLGVDLDDIEKAFEGEFVLALAAEDQGLGALAGGVAGAAMGGGTSNLNPSQLLQAGTLLLAFEETGSASETLDKVAGAVGGLTGAPARPETGTSGDFETKQLTVQGLPITTAASDDVAAVSLGNDVFGDWGDDTLGDSDAFKDAWDAADAPDESVSQLWLDAGRIATLAGLEGSDDAKLGGLVVWSVDDGTKYEIGGFLHVATS